MLLVKTKIKPSGTHGIGLFADQFILKGTITWKYDPKFDSSFTEKDLEEMSDGRRTPFYGWRRLIFQRLQLRESPFQCQWVVVESSRGRADRENLPGSKMYK